MAGRKWRIGWLATAIAVSAIVLGACARHEQESMGGRSYGSLKDDYADTPHHAAKPRAVAMKAKAESMDGPEPRVLPAVSQARIETPPPPDLSKRNSPVAGNVSSAPALPPPAAPAPAPAQQAMTNQATETAPAPAETAPAAPIETQPAEPQPAPVAAAPVQKPEPPQSAAPAVAPAPRQAETQPLDTKTVEALLSEGKSLFEAGRVVEARRRFIAAMSGPNPDVLLALARSYDTYYLSRLPSADAAPDMQRALVLYERAADRGAIEANADLERTRSILKIPR